MVPQRIERKGVWSPSGLRASKLLSTTSRASGKPRCSRRGFVFTGAHAKQESKFATTKAIKASPATKRRAVGPGRSEITIHLPTIAGIASASDEEETPLPSATARTAESSTRENEIDTMTSPPLISSTKGKKKKKSNARARAVQLPRSDGICLGSLTFFFRLPIVAVLRVAAHTGSIRRRGRRISDRFWSDPHESEMFPDCGINITTPVKEVGSRLVQQNRARLLFMLLEQDTLNKFGRTGVIQACTFHSCPEIRGCTSIYGTAN